MTHSLIIERDAAISDCGRYRWTLSRSWDRMLRIPWVAWVMLNPSTADAAIDDRTIVRCMGFARDWGFGGMTVVNLFGLRATDPAELRRVEHPVCPPGRAVLYDELLTGVRDVCTTVVAAWGTHGDYLGRGRQVYDLFERAGVPLHCLGTAKSGQPRHPLYLAGTTPLRRFSMTGGAA